MIPLQQRQRTQLNLIDLEEDYLTPDENDSDEMLHLKSIIKNELSDLDRALLVIYAEKESMQKTGDVFMVSSATICNKIKLIRQHIQGKINKCDLY